MYCRPEVQRTPEKMQETSKTIDPTPSATTPPIPTPATPLGEEEAAEEETREVEDLCPTHLSSGYASSDSSGAGAGQAATPLPAGDTTSRPIQSDPQQSAFRPAMPAQVYIYRPAIPAQVYIFRPAMSAQVYIFRPAMSA